MIARYSGYRTCDPGEVIFEQGTHREELYLVKQGSISIRRRQEDDGEQEIARFVNGEVFGEMDLLDTEPRSASAVAEGATTLLVSSRTASSSPGCSKSTPRRLPGSSASCWGRSRGASAPSTGSSPRRPRGSRT